MRARSQAALNLLGKIHAATGSDWRAALALLEIVVLWLAILLTTLLCWRVSVAAGVLLLPYLAWVSFAGVLNGALWWLNRPPTG